MKVIMVKIIINKFNNIITFTIIKEFTVFVNNIMFYIEIPNSIIIITSPTSTKTISTF